VSNVRLGGVVEADDSDDGAMPAGHTLTLPKVIDDGEGGFVVRPIECVHCDTLQLAGAGSLDAKEGEEPLIMVQMLLGDGGLFKTFTAQSARRFVDAFTSALDELEQKGFNEWAQTGLAVREEDDEDD
jgi:hypothetical protein